MFKLLAKCSAVALLVAAGVILGQLSPVNATPRMFSGWTDPAATFEAYTASDSTNFTGSPSRGIYVGTGGTVVLVDTDGTTCTVPNVPSGIVLPVVAKRINATTTTATGFVIFH
jgi:hypothetical protein